MFAIYWDNGTSACGVFTDRFETEEDAQAFADDWVERMTSISEPLEEGEDGYTAEVIEAPGDTDTEGEGWSEHDELHKAGLSNGRP